MAVCHEYDGLVLPGGVANPDFLRGSLSPREITYANPARKRSGVGNVAYMLLAALRDMQWRKRRFVIAILSTAIIFAMTLVLTGLANGFRTEAQRTVDSLGVDVFLVKDGASGPFVGATPFAPVDLRRIATTAGVQAAAPLVYAGGTVTLGDATRNADLFGAPERGPGMPTGV